MQIVDKDGNIFGNGLEVTGPDGKPKTTGGGGGSPTGPAGGDLFGTYPNPGVVWTNGIPTYDLQYYPLSLNPAGYLTSLTALDITTALGYTPYSNTNPAGYIDSSALLPYLTAVTAASTYYPLTNPNAYISGITGSMVTTALGYTPYNSTNPSNYITSAALTPYLTSASAALTYYPLSNPSGYINSISSSDVITALGFTPYNSTNPAGYIDVSALSPYLKSSVAASTYYPLTNPSNYISDITGSMVTTALGYVPYDSANPDAYITADALTPYLTIADAEVKYYPVTNPSSYISGITSADVTTALGYIPYSNSNPAGYITSSALGPYLTAATASSTYQTILVSSINIKTINGSSVLGSGDLTVSGSGATWGGITGTLSNQTDLQSALNDKQDTLVSGTSIKTVNGNTLLGSGDVTINGNPKTLTSMVGSNLIGTANQISASYRIAGGTIATNNSIYIRNVLTKSAGSTASTARMYINTSNSLTGATLLATAGSMTGATYIQRFERNFYFDGTNLYVYNPSNAISTDLTSGTLTSVAFNPANDYFLIFAVQNSTTTPDNLGHKRVIIQLYD